MSTANEMSREQADLMGEDDQVLLCSALHCSALF
jgi:hypothetical protein